jgi:hypothetical protein
MTVEERRQARLAKLKANLVIGHDQDDAILTLHLNAAMDYAGKFQHKDNAYYNTHRMSPITLQAGSCLPASTTIQGWRRRGFLHRPHQRPNRRWSA